MPPLDVSCLDNCPILLSMSTRLVFTEMALCAMDCASCKCTLAGSTEQHAYSCVCIRPMRRRPVPKRGAMWVLNSFHQASLVSGMSSMVLHNRLPQSVYDSWLSQLCA